MFSPRSLAQLGVAGACVVLVFSLSVLVAGAADNRQPTDQRASTISNQSSASLGAVEMLPSAK